MPQFKRRDVYAKKRAASKKDEGPYVPNILPDDKLSKYQQAAVEDLKHGSGHTVIRARAGSGKTFLLEQCVHRIPSNMKVLMCAFNKDIKDELSRRIRLSNVDISTLHGFGFKTALKYYGKGAALDKYKAIKIAQTKVPDPEKNWELVEALRQTVSLCKGYLAEDPVQIDEIMDKHGVTLPKSAKRSDFINTVIEAIQDHLLTFNKTGQMDFDDMIWIPVKLGIEPEKFDRVFIDETQDLNLAQIILALAAVKNNGRIFAVGDPEQSIYSFRGAAADAMDVVREQLQAKVLPLSITYRCARKIVEVCKEVVPDFEAAENAEEGYFGYVDYEEMVKCLEGGEFVLSRTNAPLMKLCMRLLKENKRANIAGRDFGKNLIYTINRSECKTVPEFLNYIEDWGEEECTRLAAKKRDTSFVKDKVECFVTICEGAKTLQQVVDRINEMFSDETGHSMTTLSTVHKSKGLEKDVVYMLTSTFKKGKNKEEDNIYYVACSRAKKELYFVE